MSKSRSMESLYSVGAASDDSCYDSNANLASNSSSNYSNNPNLKRTNNNIIKPVMNSSGGGSSASARHANSSKKSNSRARYIAEIDEVRVNPIVSKKGYLNFLEEKSIGWTKRYVVIRRPYVLIYNNDRDPLERGIINLSTVQIVYNEEQVEMLQVI